MDTSPPDTEPDPEPTTWMAMDPPAPPVDDPLPTVTPPLDSDTDAPDPTLTLPLAPVDDAPLIIDTDPDAPRRVATGHSRRPTHTALPGSRPARNHNVAALATHATRRAPARRDKSPPDDDELSPPNTLTLPPSPPALTPAPTRTLPLDDPDDAPLTTLTEPDTPDPHCHRSTSRWTHWHQHLTTTPPLVTRTAPLWPDPPPLPTIHRPRRSAAATAPHTHVAPSGRSPTHQTQQPRVTDPPPTTPLPPATDTSPPVPLTPSCASGTHGHLPTVTNSTQRQQTGSRHPLHPTPTHPWTQPQTRTTQTWDAPLPIDTLPDDPADPLSDDDTDTSPLDPTPDLPLDTDTLPPTDMPRTSRHSHPRCRPRRRTPAPIRLQSHSRHLPTPDNDPPTAILTSPPDAPDPLTMDTVPPAATPDPDSTTTAPPSGTLPRARARRQL